MMTIGDFLLILPADMTTKAFAFDQSFRAYKIELMIMEGTELTRPANDHQSKFRH